MTYSYFDIEPHRAHQSPFHCRQPHRFSSTQPTMLKKHRTAIAPYAFTLSVRIARDATASPEDITSLNIMTSRIGGISVQPRRSTAIDQTQYACALTIAHACQVIARCHKDAQPRRGSGLLSEFLGRRLKGRCWLQLPIPPTLRLLMRRRFDVRGELLVLREMTAILRPFFRTKEKT